MSEPLRNELQLPQVSALTAPWMPPQSEKDNAGKSGSEKLRLQVIGQVIEMARYLFAIGHRVGPLTTNLLNQLELDDRSPDMAIVAAAHHECALRIRPANPSGICAAASGYNMTGVAAVLGPTRGVRRLTIGGIFFALCFLIVTLSRSIDEKILSDTILTSSGVRLAFRHVLLLSSAGLGAVFGVLFTVWYDLARRQYDPLSESAHWMRIGLGLVAGVIMSEIILLGTNADGSGSPAVDLGFNALTMALLGGFSAAFLHRILTRLMLQKDKIARLSMDAVKSVSDETAAKH